MPNSAQQSLVEHAAQAYRIFGRMTLLNHREIALEMVMLLSVNELQHGERVSVVVLTKNEEQLLGTCLRELSWADEILVVDSGSTDATCEIAEAHGARVVAQPFLGWSRQRNAAAAAATYDWVIFLDADEIVTGTLSDSVQQVLASSPDPRNAYAVDRRDEFWNELLPQTQRNSHMFDRIRLYHRGHSHWDETVVVHEEVLVPGRKFLLDGVLMHWRPQTLEDTTIRMARYSVIEAQALVLDGQRPSRFRMVAMPIARFLWLFVLKRCHQSGTPGFVYAVNRSYAEFLRYAGLFEPARPAVPATPCRSMIDV